MQVHQLSASDATTRDAAKPVQLHLLGGFELVRWGQPVLLAAAEKAATLLSYLALRPGHRASRETLIEAIWPDSDCGLAGQSLNSLVYSLRKLLSDALEGAPPVVHESGWYRLNCEAGLEIDFVRFEDLVNAGERQARLDHEASIEAYRQAVDLYRGDLCACADVQAVVKRERLRALYLTALARLADQHFRQSDCDGSLDYALRLLAHDPCREDAHRLVMRSYVHRGERAQALHQYRLCERILRAEFDAVPEPATTALFHQVRLDPSAI